MQKCDPKSDIIKIYKSNILSDYHINNNKVQIPLNLYQTWKTHDMSKKMLKCVDSLRKANPEFNYQLYDDSQCREFLKNNFCDDVVWAYDNIIPGAFRADLWRNCILYKNGGIYLDIKLSCNKKFKLIELTDRQHFCIDRPISLYFPNGSFGIYNAVMISNANNPFLFDCIQEIVNNVRTKFYGISQLHPTGPGLMGNIILRHPKYITTLDLSYYKKHIYYRSKPIILTGYKGYRTDQFETVVSNYRMAWMMGNIYLDIIPKNVKFRTIPLCLYQSHNSTIQKTNNEFKYNLFGIKSSRHFISTHFDKDVLFAFDNLVPISYKIDLWKYCALYQTGGIYLSPKYVTFNDFRLINLTDNEYWCNSKDGIHSEIIICYPKQSVLFQAIYQIVDNIKNKYYGLNVHYPTGSMLLKNYFNDCQSMFFPLSHDLEYITYNNKIILEAIDHKCAEDQHKCLNLWNNGRIYN